MLLVLETIHSFSVGFRIISFLILDKCYHYHKYVISLLIDLLLFHISILLIFILNPFGNLTSGTETEKLQLTPLHLGTVGNIIIIQTR